MAVAGRGPSVERGRTVVLSVLLLLVAGAGLGAVQTVTIGDLYDGGTVNLAPGDTLEVKLSTPAGCSWSVAFDDAAVLRTESASAPGGSVFRFRAATTGSASVGLACRSAADPQAPAGGLFRVAVVVKEALMPRGLLLEQPDNGSDIFVVQGDVVEVRLPANPSTGHSWSISANAPSVLRPAGDPKFDPAAGGKPGAAGTQTFGFRVVSGGGAFLQLVYGRPFDKDTPPARTWGVFVAAASTGP